MPTLTRQRHLLVDPTTEPLVPPFTPAPRLDSLANKRLGLIDDSKTNARELLQAFETLLRQRVGVSDVRYHRKPSASKPADPEVIRAFAETCDYAIVAIGS